MEQPTTPLPIQRRMEQGANHNVAVKDERRLMKDHSFGCCHTIATASLI